MSDLSKFPKLLHYICIQVLYAGVIFDGADGMDHLPADLRLRIRINGKYTVILPL